MLILKECSLHYSSIDEKVIRSPRICVVWFSMSQIDRKNKNNRIFNIRVVHLKKWAYYGIYSMHFNSKMVFNYTMQLPLVVPFCLGFVLFLFRKHKV